MLPRQEKVEQQQEAEQHFRAWIVDYILALVISIGNGFGLRYGNVSFRKLAVRVWVSCLDPLNLTLLRVYVSVEGLGILPSAILDSSTSSYFPHAAWKDSYSRN